VLQGQMETKAATISRLEYEIERRRIRAAVDGSLAEVANLRRFVLDAISRCVCALVVAHP
jgi:hypothetical protein